MPANGTPPEAEPSPTVSRGGSGSLWKWVVGAIVLVIVVWQVAQGVFVKSVSVPGGGSVAFYPKQQNEPDSGNVVRQGGTQNKSEVHGRDNTVDQNGEGNQSTIN